MLNTPISQTDNVYIETETKGKAVKKAGNRIGYNYIIIKSFKESQKNDVVKCLYIKSLTNFGLCVIKEGSSGDSKDKEGRDIKDRLKWQRNLHEQLQSKLRIPQYLGSFEENGNYYLVIERLKGHPLSYFIKKNSKQLRSSLATGNKLGLQLLDYFLQIINLLKTLHQNGIIHRDATAANFMILPDGKVALIDLELSYSAQTKTPTPPFRLGTYGYMSPQQEETQTPSFQEDIYAFGAILFFAWTGISPNKLTTVEFPELTNRTSFFIPDAKLADLVMSCLHPDPDKRPSLDAIHDLIQKYKSDLQNKATRKTIKNPTLKKETIIENLNNLIGTLASPLLADQDRGWFSENMKFPAKDDKKNINKAWYASFNVGCAGVIYTLSQYKKVGFNIEPTKPYITNALNLIETKYIKNINKKQPGLHYGSDGIAATLSLAIKENIFESTNDHLNWIDHLLEPQSELLGLMTGISGQGIANLICNPEMNSPKINNRLQQYVHRLLTFQEKNGSWIKTNFKDKKHSTKGFSRGVAGVAYFLLSYGSSYNDNDALIGAQKSLDWLINKSFQGPGHINWKSSKNKELTPWWCEGAPGIALSFLKAYSIFGDPAYKQIATNALLVHSPEVLDNNLGQCHGLSGLGEIYLQAFQTLKDDIWLERAQWIIDVLIRLQKQHPKHGPYWLVDQERHPIAGFMNGNSGVIHFLLRYCFIDNIPYPMLDTFPIK